MATAPVSFTPLPGGRRAPKEDLDFYQQIYFHKLGTPVSADTYSIGKDFPRIAEIFDAHSDDGRYVLAQVANGDVVIRTLLDGFQR